MGPWKSPRSNKNNKSFHLLSFWHFIYFTSLNLTQQFSDMGTAIPFIFQRRIRPVSQVLKTTPLTGKRAGCPASSAAPRPSAKPYCVPGDTRQANLAGVDEGEVSPVSFPWSFIITDGLIGHCCSGLLIPPFPISGSSPVALQSRKPAKTFSNSISWK